MLSLPVFVKDINNLSDARYCAGMGVEWIGFNVENSSSAIDPNTFHAIVGWLEGIGIVGCFGDSPFEHIISTCASLGCTVVETSNPSIIAPLKEQGFTVFLSATVSKQAEIDVNPDYLLLKDGDINATNSNSNTPVFIDAKVTLKDLELLKSNSNVYGIVLYGGHETRPGFNNFETLADILEALEMD